MKNVQNATCDGDFAPLKSQNCCEIKFRPIYMMKSLCMFYQKAMTPHDFYFINGLQRD